MTADTRLTLPTVVAQEIEVMDAVEQEYAAALRTVVHPRLLRALHDHMGSSRLDDAEPALVDAPLHGTGFRRSSADAAPPSG